METAILNKEDEELGSGEYGQLAFRNKLPHFLFEGYFNKDEATLSV